MFTLPQGILECRQEGHPECTLSTEKSEKCPNDKNGPLKNLHFPRENCGRPRMCGFLEARVPFQNVHCSLGNYGSCPGGKEISIERTEMKMEEKMEEKRRDEKDADTTIHTRADGPAVQSCRDSNVACKWINDQYSLGQKYRGRVGQVQKPYTHVGKRRLPLRFRRLTNTSPENTIRILTTNQHWCKRAEKNSS